MNEAAQCRDLNITKGIPMKILGLENAFKRTAASLAMIAAFSGAARAEPVTYNYKMILYFADTTPFEDELTIVVADDGSVTGRLHVPNDFDADIENARFDGVDGENLEFHVTLPPKYDQSFPGGLRYRLTFAELEGCPRGSYCLPTFGKEYFAGFAYSAPKNRFPKTKYVGTVAGFLKK